MVTIKCIITFNSLVSLSVCLPTTYIRENQSMYWGIQELMSNRSDVILASVIIFAHILQVIKHNTVDGVQHFKFVYSSTPLVSMQILQHLREIIIHIIHSIKLKKSSGYDEVTSHTLTACTTLCS